MEDRSRQPVIFKVVICGGVVFAFAMVGAFVLIDRMAASDRHPMGTIQISRQGSTCQRLVIDSSTGAIKSSQQIACGDPPKDVPAPIEAAPSRYSSGERVDAIRDSFRNR